MILITWLISLVMLLIYLACGKGCDIFGA